MMIEFCSKKYVAISIIISNAGTLIRIIQIIIAACETDQYISCHNKPINKPSIKYKGILYFAS